MQIWKNDRRGVVREGGVFQIIHVPREKTLDFHVPSLVLPFSLFLTIRPHAINQQEDSRETLLVVSETTNHNLLAVNNDNKQTHRQRQAYGVI